MTPTQLEIDRLSARRQAVWAGAPETVAQETKMIAKRLEVLYEARREEECAAKNGDRDTLKIRAKVETELDKLTTPPTPKP